MKDVVRRDDDLHLGAGRVVVAVVKASQAEQLVKLVHDPVLPL